MTEAPSPWTAPLRLTGPDRDTPRDVDLQPDAATRAALADHLGITAVKKLRLSGRLIPEGRHDWHLTARLGATVVQPCAVTLQPVTTRINETVERRYVADLPAPPPGETEMPEDDTVDPLPETLDLGAVMAEALALALPDFPRADDAELGAATFAAPGVRPMSDDDVKPLAGLAALRDRLDDGGDQD